MLSREQCDVAMAPFRKISYRYSILDSVINRLILILAIY